MGLIQAIEEKNFRTGYKRIGYFYYWIAIHNVRPNVILVSKSRDWKDALENCYFMVDKWSIENLFYL
ncbi:MAG: hypothetical protein JNM24_17485 [Bdellovibrionaceae bacterium]|nr:hypothetical protein [Pseudobdellovibrionaceae bacterium]